MLSVTMLVPFASPRITVICGCISVGNPGYGSVLTCVLISRLFAVTRTASSEIST